MKKPKGGRVLSQDVGLIPDDHVGSKLFGPEMLGREEGLKRFFTPKPRSEWDTSVRAPHDRMVRLGSAAGTTLLYRPTTPYLNHQIREVYDVDHINSIATDLEASGQLQECGVAAFTTMRALEEYVRDASDFYETDTKVDDIQRHTKFGMWLITVYGHNRQLAAAASNLRNNGHPDKGIQLRAHVHEDPSFLDFLHMQASENTGQKPAAWSRARSMARMFELGLRDGNNYSFRDIAKNYAVDEDQVWRAHNYVQLPKTVQSMVEKDLLPYSGAIELYRLIDVYAEQDVHGLAVEACRNNWSAKQIAQEVAKRVNVRSIPAEFQEFVSGDNVKPKQAELICDMHSAGAVGADLRQFIMWVTRGDNPPRVSEIQQKIAERRRTSRQGQTDIFGGGYDEGVANSERTKVAISSQRMEVGRTVSSIAGQIARLDELLRTGALVDIVDGNPITGKVTEINGHLQKSIDGIVGQTGLEDLATIQSAADRLVTAHPKYADVVFKIITDLGALLELEAGSDSTSQNALIQTARARLTSQSTSVQEVMF